MKFKKVIPAQSIVTPERQRPKWQHLKDSEKAGFVRLWKESGLSQKKFCTRHGLNHSTLAGWVTKFEEDKNTAQPQEEEATQPEMALDMRRQQLVIKLPNGAVIQLMGYLSPSLVTSLIPAAAQCKFN